MADVIRKKKVLVVEGKDEINFFEALLRHVGILDIDIKEAGGKIQFKNKIPALVRMRGFSNVNVLAVIQDADEDAQVAFESVRDVLRNQQLCPPENPSQFSDSNPRIGIFIMPGSYDKGMLEDLCLKTARDHPAMKCVNMFADCVQQLEEPPQNMAKAKAQAFLAAMPEITNCIWIGAQKNYLNFYPNELNSLKSFLENLRQ